METFLERISDIRQCQLLVINNDNTNNGRYENNHFRPVVPKSIPKTPNPSKKFQILPFLKKSDPEALSSHNLAH
jgi:hypothetical protein